MRRVCTAEQVRALDHAVIHGLGVPGAALMETASRGVALAIRRHHLDAARRGTVVVCGGGNNGGDGYAVARWLHGWGIDTAIWSLSPRSSGDAAPMRAAALALGIPEVEGVEGAGLVVDAIFGTGLTRDVSGEPAGAIRAITACGSPVVAVDLPSGLCSDTGAVRGVAVRADRTVTFGYLKLGLLGEPGADHAGVIDVVDIGLDAADPDALLGPALAEVPDFADDLAGLWPVRGGGDHKGRSGHLAVVAGSRAMAGAAILACRGALACGVGLLTLVTAAEAYPRLADLPPEVMVVVADDATLQRLPEIREPTAWVVGPGLGGGEPLTAQASATLEEIWRTRTAPAVFDADALACVGGAPGGPRVITPHPGEAGRLLGSSSGAVQADRFRAARALARPGVVGLLKGRNTLISTPDRPISVNPTGGPVLATGGSGDVLAGMIGALLARGLGTWDATRVGAWLHGAAGDWLAERAGPHTATDIAAAVPAVLQAARP